MPGGYENIWPSWMIEDLLNSKSVDKRLRVQVPYLFVYGILKRGKFLDLGKRGAKFLCEAVLPEANLYRIGAGVGLKLEPGLLDEVHGEVFEIPDGLWHWLDTIENNGVVYTRKIVKVGIGNLEGPDFSWMNAWVYEHNSYFLPEERIENGIYTGDYGS